ncbi:hypothetical protein FC19_GL001717 [Liquorilactobacillus aquaticus DSM 21051]|uniref:Competence protein ComGD n=1 Tax=Liquorilactobacillus aquaticus DSM 21051 TaxID=1423725 RepID=A0A0R2CUV8_9LACO|nr:type II secretion system protein [Liquorilactobacillus aquaticus]KRM95581.1 hypothetical protein FC19_GL001717 [Liquorilactobacillus aquaticus DSM 21051]
MRNKQSAFSLAEILVVLALSAFTLLLTVSPLENSINGLQEKIFWQSFKQTWTNEIISSSKFKKVHTIAFKNNKIVFSEKNNRKVMVRLPKTMSIRRYESISVNDTGSISGRTIIVDSTLQDKPYYIMIQLGWGKYHVTH